MSNLPELEIDKQFQKDQFKTSKLPKPIESKSRVVSNIPFKEADSLKPNNEGSLQLGIAWIKIL
ncbi:6664_t:CDS:2 [Dentiscutata heterogama]|uniref:6664_t:CDS:1 n=1 Tax=Dentiscutata heterogama TaxID=1316150 RepID=A0ACA9KDH6_9GLOM|nr:6664_t:CDS:2 [Dentiscutata heterogama]